MIYLNLEENKQEIDETSLLLEIMDVNQEIADLNFNFLKLNAISIIRNEDPEILNEGFKEFISKFIKMIKDWLKKFWNWVTGRKKKTNVEELKEITEIVFWDDIGLINALEMLDKPFEIVTKSDFEILKKKYERIMKNKRAYHPESIIIYDNDKYEKAKKIANESRYKILSFIDKKQEELKNVLYMNINRLENYITIFRDRNLDADKEINETQEIIKYTKKQLEYLENIRNNFFSR